MVALLAHYRVCIEDVGWTQYNLRAYMSDILLSKTRPAVLCGDKILIKQF